MFEDAKNYVKRKIHKLDYTNITLPSGYEETEAEYKRLRDDLDMITAVIKSLSYYEYGSQYFKQFASVSNIVASKSNIQALKRDDIYTDAAKVGEHFVESTSDKEFREVSQRFADAWIKVSNAKVTLNAKLSDAQNAISALRRTTKTIDGKRKKAGKERYELEEAAQKDEPADIQKKSEYESNSKEVLKEMKEFIGDSGLAGVMKKIMVAYKDFSSTTSSSLSGFGK